MLPSELVIPFFAQCKLLEHVQWVWGDDAAQLIQLAPLMEASIEDKHYKPSFSAFQAGKLHWTWDEETWSIQEREALDEVEYGAQPSGMGLSAAFSAAVFSRYYGTEATASDLRREYPLLLQETARLPQA